jgi:hypothetical protein
MCFAVVYAQTIAQVQKKMTDLKNNERTLAKNQLDAILHTAYHKPFTTKQ